MEDGQVRDDEWRTSGERSRGDWRFEVVRVLAVLAVVGCVVGHWSVRRHWLPGNWLGDQGSFLPRDQVVWPAIGLALFFVASLLLYSHRRFGMLGVVAVLCLGPFFVRWPSDWMYRWKAERSSYLEAASWNRIFGDLHQETVNGRQLTYFRWQSWGIDNAEGIVHDYRDRLDVEADRLAFRSVTGGVMWTVVRIEPGWFYVRHS